MGGNINLAQSEALCAVPDKILYVRIHAEFTVAAQGKLSMLLYSELSEGSC